MKQDQNPPLLPSITFFSFFLFQEHLSLKENNLASIHGDLSTLSHLRVRIHCLIDQRNLSYFYGKIKRFKIVIVGVTGKFLAKSWGKTSRWIRRWVRSSYDPTNLEKTIHGFFKTVEVEKSRSKQSLVHLEMCCYMGFFSTVLSSSWSVKCPTLAAYIIHAFVG